MLTVFPTLTLEAKLYKLERKPPDSGILLNRHRLDENH